MCSANIEYPDTSPFFIVGAPRSGTTLVRLILNMHSRLCVPPESHFIPELVKGLRHGWTTKDFWNAITAHARFIEWELDPELFRTKLSMANADWREVFSLVYEEYAQHVRKVRWGDKTPGYVRHLKLLNQIFPDAKIIHVIRDGRDVACSLQSVPWYEGTLADCANYWRVNVKRGCRHGRRFDKKRYLEIRYENLVNNPEGTIREVCHFIGEDFEPAMLQYYLDAEEQMPEHSMAYHQNLMQPINQTAVRRWERDMSAADVATFETYAGSLLRTLGYDAQTGLSAAALVKQLQWKLNYLRKHVVRCFRVTRT
ncbi:MAG: sulfotransferase [Phycisphaerae bacterium]